MINLSAKFNSKIWRLNNLYRIVDKNGNSIPFKLNSVQQEVAECTHNRKLILKARQLGLSTYAVLDVLDEALFTENLACGIVSYSLEHAQHIFKRIIGHALDTFPKELKPLIGILTQSARELTFANGSFIRVDTSLRGGSYPCILVSEFGKTCARSPLKAEEVVTGTLQAVPSKGRVIIESTAEGAEGFFAEMCQKCIINGNDNLTELDYYFFFHPWFKDPSYTIQSQVTIDSTQVDYFESIEKECSVKLSEGQRRWYAHQSSILGDKIKQEFPSTPKESFFSSSDAYYYAECVEGAYKESRVLQTPIYDPLEPTYAAMDIGATDLTCIIFFQVVHGEIRIIDYYEDNNKSVDFYVNFMLQDKSYLLRMIFLPHDAAHKDGIIVENSYKREMDKLIAHTKTKTLVLPRTDKSIGIANAKVKFSRCVFNEKKCKALINHLSKYRKKWSEQYGRFIDEDFHDIHSHSADAFRYTCQAVTHIETISMQGVALEKHKQIVESRRRTF